MAKTSLNVLEALACQDEVCAIVVGVEVCGGGLSFLASFIPGAKHHNCYPFSLVVKPLFDVVNDLKFRGVNTKFYLLNRVKVIIKYCTKTRKLNVHLQVSPLNELQNYSSIHMRIVLKLCNTFKTLALNYLPRRSPSKYCRRFITFHN